MHVSYSAFSFTLYRTSTVILFNYEIKSIILSRRDFIKDLGVILDRKLSFHDHMDAIISKSKAMLGLVRVLQRPVLLELLNLYAPRDCYVETL